MVYTDYVSAATQRTEARHIIPLVVEEIEATAQAHPLYIYGKAQRPGRARRAAARYVGARVFTAMLEAAASSYASEAPGDEGRTDNASELIEDLTREYNQYGRPRSQGPWRSSRARKPSNNGS